MASMSTQPAVERMYTVNELADAWRVSPIKLYRLIRTRHLRAARIGRAVRVPASSAATFVQERFAGGKPSLGRLGDKRGRRGRSGGA